MKVPAAETCPLYRRFCLSCSSAELQEAVARQLLSTDPSLQAAAIRCLASFKLPYLPQHLQALLLQLADVAKLRSGLINIPMMFDSSSSGSSDAGVEAEHQVQQQQRHQLKGKKGNSSDVGRVDAHVRPGTRMDTVSCLVQDQWDQLTAAEASCRLMPLLPLLTHRLTGPLLPCHVMSGCHICFKW